MGRGIAMALCLAGFETIIVEQDEKSLAFCKNEIAISVERELAFARMKEEQALRIKKIKYTTDLSELSKIDLVI